MKTKPGRSSADQPTPEQVRMMKGRYPDTHGCNIDIARIRSDPNQPRKFFDGIDKLAASMKAHGQLEPILVRWVPSEGVYEIIAGERRYRAAEMAGLKSMRACVWDEVGRMQEGDKLELQLVENHERENVLPLEHAAGIKRLMDLKRINASQAAERLQMNKGTVSKLVALLDLDDDTKQRVDNGEISASAAYELTKIADVKERRAIAERAVKTKLTRDEVANLVATKRFASSDIPKRIGLAGEITIGPKKTPEAVAELMGKLHGCNGKPANGKIVPGIGWNSKKAGLAIEPVKNLPFDPKTDLEMGPHGIAVHAGPWSVRLDVHKDTSDPQTMAAILRDVADAVEREGRGRLAWILDKPPAKAAARKKRRA